MHPSLTALIRHTRVAPSSISCKTLLVFHGNHLVLGGAPLGLTNHFLLRCAFQVPSHESLCLFLSVLPAYPFAGNHVGLPLVVHEALRPWLVGFYPTQLFEDQTYATSVVSFTGLCQAVMWNQEIVRLIMILIRMLASLASCDAAQGGERDGQARLLCPARLRWRCMLCSSLLRTSLSLKIRNRCWWIHANTKTWLRVSPHNYAEHLCVRGRLWVPVLRTVCVLKRRNSWACRGNPNPEQETICVLE